MEHEQYEPAIQLLRAAPLPTCDPRVDLLLGAAFEGSGNLSQAEQVLRQARLRWPTNDTLATSLARCYLLSGQPANAAEALNSTAVSATTPLQELELRAEVYLAVHQLKLAQGAAELAYKTYPSEQPLLLLANVLQTQGRSGDVVLLLQSKRAQYGESLPFLITIAESEYDAGTYAVAKSDLEHAVEIDRRSYLAHYLLGNTLVKQTQTAAGIAEYRTAIELAPDKPRTYYQLALALVIQGDVPEAEHSLTQALAVDERYAPAYCEMGELLMQQGHFAEAVDPLLKAIDSSPSLEIAYYQLTRVYSRLGNKKESEEMLKRYLDVKAANRKRPAKQNAEEESVYHASSLAQPPQNP